MPAQQIRPTAAVVAVALAAGSGVAVYLLTGQLLAGLTALVGALLAAAGALLLGASPGAPAAAPVAQPEPNGTAPDRANLVRTCIYVRDRVTSTALASRLDQALAEVGVNPVEPTGERFDPSHHEAGGALATTDDQLVGTIAAVEAPGYSDRGVLLRPPVVTVYQRRTS